MRQQEPIPPIPAATERVGAAVVDACVAVHRALGPGLLERMYREALRLEIGSRGLRVDAEVPIGVHYRGSLLPGSYRADLIVEGLVLVETKAVEHVLPVHEYQVLTYLKLTGLRLGFLINFNVPNIRSGIRRKVHMPERPHSPESSSL